MEPADPLIVSPFSLTPQVPLGFTFPPEFSLDFFSSTLPVTYVILSDSGCDLF